MGHILNALNDVTLKPHGNFESRISMSFPCFFVNGLLVSFHVHEKTCSSGGFFCSCVSQVFFLTEKSRDPGSRFLPFAKPQTKTSLRPPLHEKTCSSGGFFCSVDPTGFEPVTPTLQMWCST